MVSWQFYLRVERASANNPLINCATLLDCQIFCWERRGVERAGDTRHNFPENYKQKYSPLKWTHRHSEGARLTLTARGDDVKSEKRRGGKSNKRS